MTPIHLKQDKKYTCGNYSASGQLNVPLRVIRGKLRVEVYEQQGTAWSPRHSCSQNGPGTLSLSIDQEHDGVWQLEIVGIAAANDIEIDPTMSTNILSLNQCIDWDA
jgi:hypothetical protein